MDENELYAIEVLESLSCQVEKIEESNIEGEKRPDFFVTIADEQHIIELKTKDISRESYDSIFDIINENGVCTRSINLDRENKYSKVISNAKSQLESYNLESFSFKILWLHSVGSDSHNHMEQFKRSLFGIKTLVDFDYEDGARDCYFYFQSDFYKYRSILDAAFITRDGYLQLCLNPYSENYHQMKESSLFQALENNQLDPIKLEQNGEIYYADSDMPRSNTENSLKYLREKYGYPNLIEINMESTSAHAILPN